VEAQELGAVMDWLDLRGKLAVGWNKDDGKAAASERKEGIAAAENIHFWHLTTAREIDFWQRPAQRAYSAAVFTDLLGRSFASYRCQRPTVKSSRDVMPALSSHDAFASLEKREWSQTVGQSGMTPTAFAFLIPVFVVVVFAPL
jgi:hypothetical protein